MRLGRRARWIAIAAGIALVCLVGLGVLAFQPWTANHFGYALPGRNGLPYRIQRSGRSYATYQVCAGAIWCAAKREQVGTPRCWSRAWLNSRHFWPLTQVGWIPSLLGPSYRLMQPAGDQGQTAPLIVSDGGDCYVAYSLEGGP
jgi:hypothetical protein